MNRQHPPPQNEEIEQSREANGFVRAPGSRVAPALHQDPASLLIINRYAHDGDDDSRNDVRQDSMGKNMSSSRVRRVDGTTIMRSAEDKMGPYNPDRGQFRGARQG